MNIRALFLILIFSGLSIAPLFADADAEWQAILDIEEQLPNPGETDPESYGEQLQAALQEQEGLLRAYLQAYPEDSRIYEAHLRLAAVTSQLGFLNNDPTRVETARRMLANVENHPGASSEDRASAAFQQVALTMREARANPRRQRDQLDQAITQFQQKYPDDRRIAGLQVELAGLYDNDPGRMHALLTSALESARDEQVRRRAEDDLRRLNLLGETPDFDFRWLDGGTASLSDYRGQVVLLFFWASWSVPSLMELENARRTLADQEDIVVLTISLDEDPSDARAALERLRISWPTHCDGESWESPVLREWGLNALPTVWAFDRQGRLRTLNARESPLSFARLLNQEP